MMNEIMAEVQGLPIRLRRDGYGATRERRVMAAFRKWLDEHHPADPKIEVSVVENKV